MTSLPVPVEKELIELAFLIYDFLHETGPKFLDEIGKEPAEHVIFVVDHNPKLPRATRFQTPTRLTYPANWIDNGNERRQTFRNWFKKTTPQLQHRREEAGAKREKARARRGTE